MFLNLLLYNKINANISLIQAEEARKRILIDDMNQLKAQFQEDLVRVQEELAGLKQQRESMHARDREYFERIAQMKVQLSEEQSAK